VALAPGTRIGPYEIAAQLGVGGMGEVYRATDTNLKRQVAIKVLPEAVAADAERLARFQREAEVLGALNHPNIAHIHGLEKTNGTFALVMELVEGPTLADRIAQGAIPVEEALSIATQITEALEAAHEQGIIHRDLKPANIKVREDGTVKVLDFGLAKALDPAASSLNASMSPTITTPAMTQAGMILGTAAYMSPEQARGRPVDKRADIWAFGAVLFEMLTAHAPFPGSDVVEVLGAVVHKEPVWTDLPVETPPTVRATLQRCLEKDPKRRMRDIGDVRLALTGTFDTPLPATAVAASASTVTARVPWMWVGASLLVGGLATAGAMKFAGPRPAPPQPVRRVALTMLGSPLAATEGALVAISPDGRVLVYRVREQGVGRRLYRRRLDELEGTPISGTEGAGGSPFFSPDGQWLGFRDLSTGMLVKLSLAGGRPVRIGEIGGYQGASWEADGSIVLGLGGAGLVKVAAGGGVPVTLTKPDDGRLDWYPQTLPGGRAVLFTTSGRAPDTADIMALDLQSGKRQTVLRGGSAGRFVSTGHLVFVRDQALWAVRFNPATLLVSGDPVLVEQGIRVESGGAVQFAVADDTLTYIPETSAAESRTLVWVDRSGREEPLASPARTYLYPRISPDGQRVAIDVRDQEFDIWIWSVAGQTLTRLTTDPAPDEYPVWAPDSQRIVFASLRAKGARNLYMQRADGTGAVERLTTSQRTQAPNSISPDGRALIFTESNPKTTSVDLMRMPLWPPGASPARTGGERDAGASGAQGLIQTPFPETNGEVSPDGRWLAYQSSDSGRTEIYVRPFPDVNAGRAQVSSTGGHSPLWDRTGRELYFRSEHGAVMRVNVLPGNTWQNSPPAETVPARYYDLSPAGRTFDVAPDGKRFLMIKQPVGEAAVQNIVVVTNWFEELKRLVPAK
jgi:serine/threonine-protein kinase